MNRVVVRGVAEDDARPGAWDARAAAGFTGALGQSRVEQHGDEVVALAGLGRRSQRGTTALRRAAATVARSFHAVEDLVMDVDLASFGASSTAEVAAVAEGIAWGGYRFRMTGAESYTSGTHAAIPRAHGAAGLEREGWARGEALGAAVNLARDLVNLPPSVLTPCAFAERSADLLRSRGLRVRIIHSDELRDGGYGGIVAIGQGSTNPPALLEVEAGEGPPELALVGKGVTFDSGGLSLKPAPAQMAMKSDMAGAAAVVGVLSLLPTLARGRSVVGVIPLVENLPGPGSVRPGDVVRLRDGATLEILDTDFEGRVILADALSRAAEFGPETIIDIASLTYAAQHALGDDFGALVANDDALAARVEQAGARSGDRVWRMPLQPELEAQIRSDVADYKNFPGVASARVSSAALLLSRFVGGIPWAHVDMAGPAFRPTADAGGAAGGTGYGVRLLAELIAQSRTTAVATNSTR